MADDETLSAMRAVAHPVRLRMLSLLTGAAMSAAEVARELGLTHANASYHLRQLAAAGEVVEAGEERIRGGVAKRYRYPHEREIAAAETLAADPHPGTHPEHDPTAGRQPDPEAEVLYARALVTDLERRLRLRAPRSRGLSSDLEGWVDPESWAEAVALLQQASRILHEANRPPRTPGTLHVSATSWAFTLTEERPA